MQKTISLVLAFMISGSAFAGQPVNHRCGWYLINALAKLETKEEAPLSFLEFRFKGDVKPYFHETALTVQPEKWTKETFGIYRRPPVAKFMRQMQFNKVSFLEETKDNEFVKLLEPNQRYTYTVQDNKISFAKTKPGLVRDLSSKHAMLYDQDGPLRLAGECWVDEKGIFHFDGASGTYKPSNDVVKQGERFFREHLGVQALEPHYVDFEALNTQAQVATKTQRERKELTTAQFMMPKRTLNSLKFIGTNSYKAKMESNNQKEIRLVDENDVAQTYKLIESDVFINRITHFDTDSRKLAALGSTLKLEQAFERGRDAMVPLDPGLNQSEAFAKARKKIKSKEKFVAVSQTRTETVTYTAYRVDSKGKVSSAPAFHVIVAEEKSSDLGKSQKTSSKILSEVVAADGKPGSPKFLAAISGQLQNAGAK